MTGPAIPFESYADGLLGPVATILATVFPYAAAITAFAIGVGMVRRWLGHRSASSMSGSIRESNWDGDSYEYVDQRGRRRGTARMSNMSNFKESSQSFSYHSDYSRRSRSGDWS